MLKWFFNLLAQGTLTRATFLAAGRPRTIAPVVAFSRAAVGQVIIVLDSLVGFLSYQLIEDKEGSTTHPKPCFGINYL